MVSNSGYYDNFTLAYFAHLYLLVMLSITSVIFPLLSYVILTKSTKEMAAFKVYLCLELFWSFFFSVVFGLMRPMVYFPYMMARITGPLNILCSPQGCHLVVELLFFSGAAYAQSLFCIALFRLYRVLPMSVIYDMDEGHRRLVFLLAMLVIPCVVYVAPVAAARVETAKVLPYLLSIAPQLAPLAEHKNQLVIYNNPENNDFWVKFIYIFLSLTVLLIVTLSPIVLVIIGYMTKRSKDRMSSLRYKMSMMLFKTLIIQVVLAFSMLAFPLIVAIIFAKLDIAHSDDVVLFAGIIASSHCLAEFATIIYTIRPYRRHLFALIMNGFSGMQSRLPEPLQFKFNFSQQSSTVGIYSITDNSVHRTSV